MTAELSPTVHDTRRLSRCRNSLTGSGMCRRLARVLTFLAVTAAPAACRTSPPPLTAAGTLEMLEVDVASLQAARVVTVTVAEGDRVRVGDTLVVLALPTTDAAAAEAEARLAAARENTRALQRGARPAEIARAGAELRALDAEAGRLAADLARIEPLASRGDVSAATVDAARAASRSSTARRDASRESLRLLESGARVEERRAAAAGERAAAAAAAAVRASENDLVLRAPIDGIVTSRNTEPGEVIVPGQSALTLGAPARPWARVYVAQGVLSRMHVGDTLSALLDGDSVVYRGRVVSLASKAEFTPRVALTDQERADLLFGVRIEFDDRTGRLKAGLPITVRLPAIR